MRITQNENLFVCGRQDWHFRRAIILPIVLLIFMLLGMLAISFGFATRAEYNAMESQRQMTQARNCASSGLEVGALLLRQSFNDSSVWYDNSAIFRDQIVDQTVTEEKKETAWRFSLISYNFDSQDKPRFGITDEASKVNINTASEDQLRRLPGVTAEMAAAVMDWRESGSKARSNGAKDEYYRSLHQPYRCKQASFDTIEELLLVKGFSGEVIFGEDMNRNGILDPNENDGSVSLPIDDGDGNLNRGLYPYITVYSREPDVSDSDPYTPRMNIASWPASVLTPMLEKYLRQEVIDFIVKAQEAGADFGRSPASLLGMEVDKDGEKTTSPVTLDDMPDIMDYLTTGYHLADDGYVYGRINLNTASRTVLQTIGRLTDTEIDAILTTRNQLEAGDTKNIAWLVTKGVVTEEKFKEIAYLFTARSYQFMMDALGYADAQAVQARLQAVIELRLPRIQYIYWRDLSGLGRTYNVGSFGETDIVIEN